MKSVVECPKCGAPGLAVGFWSGPVGHPRGYVDARIDHLSPTGDIVSPCDYYAAGPKVAQVVLQSDSRLAETTWGTTVRRWINDEKTNFSWSYGHENGFRAGNLVATATVDDMAAPVVVTGESYEEVEKKIREAVQQYLSLE